MDFLIATVGIDYSYLAVVSVGILILFYFLIVVLLQAFLRYGFSRIQTIKKVTVGMPECY